MELGNEESNNFQVLLFSENHKEYLSNDNLKFNMNFKKDVQTSVQKGTLLGGGAPGPEHMPILVVEIRVWGGHY